MKSSQDTTRSELGTTKSQVAQWAQAFMQLHARLAPHFARSEPRRRVLAYLQGLMSCIERKNGWQLAEHGRRARPYGMQRLLSQAVWDADGVRDELRAYVLEELGDQAGNLVIDETSFPQRGTHASRGPKAVVRDDRARGELSSRRVSGLRQRQRLCAHRSRTLPALELDPRS